jgi:hypothetical protein
MEAEQARIFLCNLLHALHFSHSIGFSTHLVGNNGVARACKMTEDYKEYLLKLSRGGCVCMSSIPNDPRMFGIAEKSFTYEFDTMHTRLWRGDNPAAVACQVMSEIQQWANRNPDRRFWFLNPYDEGIPFTFDWGKWIEACEPSSEKISGVVNKFGARNLVFNIMHDRINDFVKRNPGMTEEELFTWAAITV